jgi:glycosyltransferase involved in cell wall biosynthesis
VIETAVRGRPAGHPSPPPGESAGRDPGSLRIAFVTETWHPSVDGIVTRLSSTLAALHRRGHQLMVLAPSGGDPVFEGIPVRAVPSLGISMVYGGKRWGLPWLGAEKHLEEFRPDLVHAVGPFLLGAAGVRHARRHGLPLVCSYHTRIAAYARHYNLGFAEGLAWARLRRLHNAADLNLAASVSARAEMEANGIAGVAVWDGGVDLLNFHPRRGSTAMRQRITRGHAERPVLLYVGRLAAEKGLEILAPLMRRRPDLHLALVGEGPDGERLRQLFAGTNTTFMGALAHHKVAEACASADVFVFPSRTDTLGLAVLEAMASGLPVLLADGDNGRELLRDPHAGALFDASDGASLEARLDGLLARRLGRWALAEMARRHLSPWATTADQLLGHYATARARRGASPAAQA